MRSLDELLDEAKWGKLTQEELDYVVDRIKESKKKEDPELYTLIFIIGKAGAIEHRELIESFLHYPSDPNISYIAFSALMNYLDLLFEYPNEIKLFLKGVAWDKYDNVRIGAIGTAGRYLTGYEDKEMLEELIKIYMDTTGHETNREAAYEALAFALGRNMNEIYGAEEIDFSILEEAQQRLAKCT